MNQQSVALTHFNSNTKIVALLQKIGFILLGLVFGLVLSSALYAQNLDLGKKSNKTDFLSSSNPKISSSYATAQVKAELLLHAPKPIQAGSSFWVGLKLSHAPHWHTYWKNPGDSGLPTELEWTLPAQWKTSPVLWPLPKKIPIGPLANYGYENDVLLMTEVKVPAQLDNTEQNPVRVQLLAKWLVCSQECIPQEGKLELEIPWQKTATQNSLDFEQAFAQQPQTLKSVKSNQLNVDGKEIELQISNLPKAWQGKKLEAMPETPEIIKMTALPVQEWSGSNWKIKIPLSGFLGSQPKQMAWVIAPADFKPTTSSPALRIELPVKGTWQIAKTSEVATSAAINAANSASNANTSSSVLASAPLASSQALSLSTVSMASGATGASSTIAPHLPNQIDQGNESQNNSLATTTTINWTEFFIALFSALVGGVLLNLMPCVFPVLAIKILHLTQYSNNATQRKQSAIAYTVGVILSFLALAGLLLTLRAAGQGLGWGFQLQNPAFVVALSVLFVLIAFNLLGMFEVGQWLPSRLGSWQASHPVLNAFMTGVLAVAVASPCTAPFMGASLGFAINLPAMLALSVFFALGLGLALPYLLAGFWPGLANYLPRPGAWMESFKQALAFPMLATTIWLVWVLGQQNGLNAAAALLMILLALGFLIWSLAQQGKTKWWLASIGAIVFAGVLYLLAGFVLETQDPPNQTSAAQIAPENSTSATGQNGAVWQAWSPALQNQLLTQGKVVFVDYTAAWCVTCQVNKKTTLNQTEVLAAFQSKNIVLLQADWTKRDAVIEKSLAQLGRNGVPVYVFYQQGKAPLILSELLTPSQVLSAIQKY